MTLGGMSSHETPRRGETDTWLTPPHVLEALGPFDLDPCPAPPPRPWDTAARHIEDPFGLLQPWEDHELVWLNPPYSDVGTWLDRLSRHPAGGIALVFARTETAWFQDLVWPRHSGLLFLRGRLSFHRPDGTTERASAAGAPSVLIAYGQTAWSRLETAWLERRLDGHIVS